MLITIRPDPDCIELIRSNFKDTAISFLKSVGISEKDAENWEATYTIEINENDPPLVDVFDMKCYLPGEVFAKTEWIIKLNKHKNYRKFLLNNCEICIRLENPQGIISVPLNTNNLQISHFSLESLSSWQEKLIGLTNLKSLQIGDPNTLKANLVLQGITNKTFQTCESLIDLDVLSRLKNQSLYSLNLSGCKSLIDISGLYGHKNLKYLNLNHCFSLKNIDCITNFKKLQSLSLCECNSLGDFKIIAKLENLKILNISKNNIIKSTSFLKNLKNLNNLDLNQCKFLTDTNYLSGLINLRILKLGECKTLKDINDLSGLTNLQLLDLNGWESLTDINSLSSLVNLESLNLEGCKRLHDYSPLKKCLALKELQASTMHPAELAELICFLAVQRKDIYFISEKAGSWLKELKSCLNEKHLIANDLACSLAREIVLANLEEHGLSFHKTFLEYNNVGVVPWKIWLSENLDKYGWDKFQKLSEIKPFSDLTFGAIGGISSCLPTLDGEEGQVAWSKKWISEIHSLHKNYPAFLRPAAAKWCLALKRLGEDQLLKEWIEKFTDPSDPSNLDPINKVFSEYTLKLNDRESALEYALKIYDPKLRDESILNLANQFLMEKEITKAGNLLFLLTEIEYRTKLAISLADDADYLKNDENAHRLIAACGDNPKSVANIFEKLRIVNPNSEILKIMHEKLSDYENSNLIASIFIKDAIKNTIKLFEIKDSTKLTKIQQAIESIVNSN